MEQAAKTHNTVQLIRKVTETALVVNLSLNYSTSQSKILL